MKYPKRLIEVDFPLKKVSEEATREKNVRVGHIKNLHIWWARRPLTACRAVLATSLWPDPVDEICSETYINNTSYVLENFVNNHLNKISGDNSQIFLKAYNNPGLLKNRNFLRKILLGFVAEFSSYTNGQNEDYIKTAQQLNKFAAIELKKNEENFTVVDPFAGGGAIPVESYRLGNTTYANDLNPLPVVINTLLLKILPKYGKEFLKTLKRAGEILFNNVQTELVELFPKEGKFEPVAYFRARTITCEGPNCGYTIPMIKKYGLSDRNGYTSVIPIVNDKTKSVDFELYQSDRPHNLHKEGTVKRGKVTCPVCGYTHHADSVKRQLIEKDGGANDAQLFAAILRNPNTGERKFRLPNQKDIEIINQASKIVKNGDFVLPDDDFHIMSGVFNAPIYGMDKWHKLYTDRQIITLNLFFSKIEDTTNQIQNIDDEKKKYIGICLGLIIGNLMHYNTSVSTYTLDHMLSAFIQGQAIPMKWDYAEANPLMSDLVGGFNYALDSFIKTLEGDISFVYKFNKPDAEVFKSSATEIPLPDDSIDCVFTDPPYYNSVPYADLSDLFLAWYKFFLKEFRPDLFSFLSEKEKELCVMNGWDPVRYGNRNEEFYTKGMKEAFLRAREMCKPDGIISIVFAHKSTKAWESLLSSVIDAGITCTASWPINTERAARMRANNSATLASSVHLVCRPRENPDGSLMEDHIGDWRDVQAELPKRIKEWMPRLAREGVVGADAIFACLGPALEIFSRYSRVEKPDGTVVTLRDYLERVWASVSQEALNMVFEGGDAGNLEEDSRVTAMWLWTLAAGTNGNGVESSAEESGTVKISGYTLEYDTARKIAQGLGANLDNMKTLVEIKGDQARLLPVHERAEYLFGSGLQQSTRRKKKQAQQLTLFEEMVPSEEEIVAQEIRMKMKEAGKTVLDRLHQAMLLFGTGRTDALKRFLSEEGAGQDDRFWKLAQALNALYPPNTEERRWVEAVQTYKKSLGF